MTNVKAYSDLEIMVRASIATKGNFNRLRTPRTPLIVAIRSQEDEPDKFDDKAYLYSPTNEFVMVTSCTTNAGLDVLRKFEKYNTGGAAILKTNEFYPKGLQYGLHNGRMQALRQVVPFKFYRDNNRNAKSEEIGKEYIGIINTNFHGIDYDPNSIKVAERISTWSAGCIVCNNMKEYRKIINYVKPYLNSDLLILQEW